MKIIAGGLGLLLILTLAWPAPAAPAREVAPGEAYPNVTFSAPSSPAHLKYLGLKPGQELNPAKIPAQAVVIEVFSMY